jgi:hypothetical protein
MSHLKTGLRVALIVLLAGVAGCGETPGSAGQGWSAALIDLRLLLEELAANKKPIPTKLAEMEPYEPLRPTVYVGLLRDDIVYQWGAGINSAGAGAVLAYEKKASTEGGWVLMQDGSLKEMTAAEFNAAPKAK